MSQKKLKVLLIAEQCNPDWSSIPLVCFNIYKELKKIVDITLVTHSRNRSALEQHGYCQDIVYINESNFTKNYYRLYTRLTEKIPREAIKRPVELGCFYLMYEEFERLVYEKFKTPVINGDYDIVHAIPTGTSTRYPVKIVKACKNTRFVLGPVNGGVPFPDWFEEVALKKYLNLSFLVDLSRFIIPGYIKTYTNADKILVGSTFTLNRLKKIFNIQDNRLSLLTENGVDKYFLEKSQQNSKNCEKITLIFVGRLVAFKCPEIAIEAVNKLKPEIKSKIQLIVVGDGPEKSKLQQQVKNLSLEDIVKIVGWVSNQETIKYYGEADIFCFPSVRESGGAVVLEAMACGLPCIIANNGGIAEYVTEETGFKIEPLSREYLTQEVTNKIELLVNNEDLRKSMSAKAIERAREFEWECKARNLVKIYQEVIGETGNSSRDL
ncbi:glycosyltransferase family 4 protein [Microseira wollei]|uniref:Glycosyl transferase, group 1 n=1 Tax=Microseira wollei NIES-4236 TaxID=2530354 RepID=A0AAV3X2I3_9CYAN|nr:glycosyltransferase family 4 protein [Microseira wollei]GET36005.1 glycosyl transferase, group 1 [Microseira wollei NIES-4236]